MTAVYDDIALVNTCIAAVLLPSKRIKDTLDLFTTPPQNITLAPKTLPIVFRKAEEITVKEQGDHDY